MTKTEIQALTAERDRLQALNAELVEALEAMVNAYGGSVRQIDDTFEVEQARAALAKAYTEQEEHHGIRA